MYTSCDHEEMGRLETEKTASNVPVVAGENESEIMKLVRTLPKETDKV